MNLFVQIQISLNSRCIKVKKNSQMFMHCRPSALEGCQRVQNQQGDLTIIIFLFLYLRVQARRERTGCYQQVVPHSGVGEDFLARQPGFFFTKTALIRKRKVNFIASALKFSFHSKLSANAVRAFAQFLPPSTAIKRYVWEKRYVFNLYD